MEKIFDVMGCEDAFKTRLAVYKFEGNVLAWLKAYKQAKGGDVWLITVTWAEFKKLFFLQFFPRAEQERLKREYQSIRQTNNETSTEFMQRFLRLAGFLGTAAGTEDEQAKNFQWGLRGSTLNHLMCMPFTDVAQVANAARNYEILHERDDNDAERPDKRQKSGDRHQPTTQQSSHKNHGHNQDRHGSDRRGGSDNHRSSNKNYSGNNNRLNFKFIRSSSTHKHDPNITSRGPSEGYSYPVCTTCGRRHLGECRGAAGTCFKYGQTGHLQKDYKKNTTASTYGQADKNPAEQERLKREYHSICQASLETSTEFMQRSFRLAGFLGAAAGTEEEQAKNFQWGLRRSTLNHLMCMSYTDVAQVANAARNYEILHERDNQDLERPDKQ
nr:hypothetical protein [Tanacetum cinerariifolium]